MMAKFHGTIGVVRSEETEPGVFSDVAHEYVYYGDVLRESRQIEKGERVNDNLRLSNRISIVADDFTLQNLQYMKYVVWQGIKWKISNLEVERPRIILSLGEVYNGI